MFKLTVALILSFIDSVTIIISITSQLLCFIDYVACLGSMTYDYLIALLSFHTNSMIKNV